MHIIINEDHLCVLKQDPETKQIDIAYVPIDISYDIYKEYA